MRAVTTNMIASPPNRIPVIQLVRTRSVTSPIKHDQQNNRRAVLGVLGCDLEIAAGVMLRELADPLGRAHRKIVPDARRDEDALDARNRSRLLVQRYQRRMTEQQEI